MEITSEDILGKEKLFWHSWGPEGADKGSAETKQIITLAAHESVLFYVNETGDLPPEEMSMGGFIPGSDQSH